MKGVKRTAKSSLSPVNLGLFFENARFNERGAYANYHAAAIKSSEIFCTVITVITKIKLYTAVGAQSVLRMDCYFLFLCLILSNLEHPSLVRHGGHFYACVAWTRA